MKITIFTPAYNRADFLPRLYKSLKQQKCQDFEWLIVDDGSTDNTKDTVEGFISENIIDIQYHFQKNSGKAAAFDSGVDLAKGDLFFCVDSDDLLAENAIDIIAENWGKEPENCCGILALKIDTDGKMLCNNIPDGLYYSSAYNLVNCHGCSGEFSLIYKSSVLKEFRFPIIQGEKFITECVLYDQIDLKYQLKLVNSVLTVCEYQEDGLSKNSYSVMLKNPTGYQIYYKNRIDMAKTSKERIGYIVRYNAFYYLSHNRKYKYDGKYNLSVLLTSPLGLLLKYYYLYKR